MLALHCCTMPWYSHSSGRVNSTRPMAMYFIGMSRSVCAITAPAPARVAAMPLLMPGQQRLAQRDQGPESANQHGADAEIADLRVPDHARGVFRAGLGDFRSQCGIGIEEEGAVDRDGDVPADDTAQQDHDADVEADDVAHAEQAGDRLVPM
jgi:hypothetical protein